MKIKKAVIPCAGQGTRFLPATKVVAKELLPVYAKPIIHYIVEEAALSGIERVIFVTSSGKDSILDYFDHNLSLQSFLERKGDTERLAQMRQLSEMVEIVSVRQKHQLGLGHAILQAADLVGDEPFAVLLGDDMIDSKVPCIKQMMRVWNKYHKAVVATFPVPHDQVDRYGIVAGPRIDKRVIQVKQMVEKPKPEDAPGNMAIIGHYILPPQIFRLLKSQRAGVGGEIQLTDALVRLNRSQGVLAYEFDGDRYDAGDVFGFIQANIMHAMKDPAMRPKLEELFRRIISDQPTA
ncbi:MAG: UTP--glucose-1-phosphate uridylyltransferase GalU [Candidatus Alcyoniella australis]|nr:UTP--glucose-1-phosphate uridylyltransferase GalU [Candidatus Alcyoniella australis]